MPNPFAASETLLRLGVFAGLFLLLAAAEYFWPRRQRRQPLFERWPTNAVLMLMNTFALRLIFPVGAAGFALLAEQRQFGVLWQFDLPPVVAIALAVVLLDMAVYGQHVLFHRMPLLWRYHGVHHTDLDIDLSTGVRFHPIEILLSMLIKLTAIALIGAPVAAVILFEILLSSGALFSHSNLKLPKTLDGWLRTVMVTPDMHRVHHSTLPDELNSNFGFALSWWDRLFGTYTAQPRDSHVGMTIGLQDQQSAQDKTIPRLLIWPWTEGRTRRIQ